jgi:hypothetical protein
MSKAPDIFNIFELPKKHLVKKIIFVLILLIVSGKMYSQKKQERMHGNFSFGAALPLNEFKDNTSTTGFGVNLNFYIPFQKDIPIYFGFGFGYYLFGSTSQELHDEIKVTAGNTVISTIPIDLRVETNNNLVDGFASIRVKAPLDNVQPYIELKGGFNYLYTRTKVLDVTEDRYLTKDQESNEINSRTAASGFTFAYGLEGGFIIKPWKHVGINLSAAYLYGGSTEYYDESQTSQWTVSFSGSGTFDPNNPDPSTLDLKDEAATPRKSITDMLIISAGITFYIPGKEARQQNKSTVPNQPKK